MPDTLVDPPAPTVSEPPIAPVYRRKTWPAIAAALAFVVACAAAAAAYLVWWRYEPLAREHIPARTSLAIRCDASSLVRFAPFRKHFAPLLDGASPSARGAAADTDRVRRATGIDVRDVREVIITTMDGRDWLLIFGGRLRRRDFTRAMLQVLPEMGVTGWRVDRGVLVGPEGGAMAQADDGVVLVGTSAEIVIAALPAGEEYKRLALPERGAIAFVASEDAVGHLAATHPAATPLEHAGVVVGTVSLGDPSVVEVDVHPNGISVDALAKEIDGALAALRLTTILVPDQYGEKAALSGAQVSADAAAVHLRAPWPADGFDRGFGAIAAALDAVLSRPRGAGSPPAPARSHAPAAPAAP